MKLDLDPAGGLLDGFAIVVWTPTLDKGESASEKVIL
jgi:hypothetical protein